ncbi:hypothetical protein ATEIFO6365_0003023700 [Aspergillus terreus]|uniref:Uncharacterized protein n=1 Tax=Aspergillus terreus TaxID=33178 RepID=A0A5M3YUZ2_ASPTE|nr:hypothetical protein ATETN484_0003017600 [Aspergillus terreus]GFF14184.1 hypothetical protein ATEIFO6365_0003023700 [Aspergillus terreus]
MEDSRPPPPPIPPSPTLSNPDMILPFDQNERESSTPSPPFNLPSLSHLQSFYENRPVPNDYGVEVTRNNAQPGGSWRQKTYPRHTWLHEGHDAASRRLSDIGEEDTSSPTYLGGFAKNSHVPHAARIARSPKLQLPDHTEAREAAEWSSSSSSTVSAPSESPMDGNTHSESGVAAEAHNSESFPLRDTVRALQQGVNGDPSRLSVISTTEEGGPADELSSVILSSEAERILENAKKRLTLMEGNLTRARSSMRMSPSLSASPTPSVGNQSLGLGQPVGGLYQSISRADRRTSVLRPRATYNSSQDTTNNRHSRVYSETHIPSSDQPNYTGVSRSLSALGSSSTSNFNGDDRSFRYEPTRAYLTHRASVSSMNRPRRVTPSPLKEETSADASQGLGISTEDKENRISNIDDFNSTYPQQDPPSRSQSQLHVRDLQDQMKGLHIKISSLKVKTQEDNLRRRSLQSLRTPSPFTAADQYYTNGLELKETRSNPSPSLHQGRFTENRQVRQSGNGSSRGGSSLPTSYDVTDGSTSKRSSETGFQAIGPTNNVDDDGQSVIESLYEDAEEGDYYTDGSSGSEIDREALNEILREPLDEDLQDPLDQFPAVPHGADSTPHEEREDAFDYEHFILHSALGNYTRSRMRRSSDASDTSVETTRPIQSRRSVRHSRANSGASLSTVATFATATEGGHDDIDSVLYWDRKFNDELHYRYPDPEEAQPSSGSESENMGTPRALRKQPSRKSGMNNRGEVQPAVQRSESATTGSATPTSLVSSLVSTVRAASSPHPKSAENGNMGINDDDTRLLEQLFQSLGNVCMDLQAITTSPEPDAKKARLLRRRLDAARRVLDGELDT